MNIIWLLMIFFSMLVAIAGGKIEIINDVIIKDSQEAVIFAMGLIGIMSVWLGLMKIAHKSGLLQRIASLTRPINGLLFPSIPPNHPAATAIMMNMLANMFGAGNSATALGIKAMEELQEINPNRERASNAMCMFLVINMSSIQIIPLTVLKLRGDAGSLAPTEIIGPSLVATTISTLAGILACKLLEGVGK